MYLFFISIQFIPDASHERIYNLNAFFDARLIESYFNVYGFVVGRVHGSGYKKLIIMLSGWKHFPLLTNSDTCLSPIL